MSKRMQRIRRAKALAEAGPIEPEPVWVAPVLGDSFYLHELGLTRECQGDCPRWGELPPVIRRGEET
ncbi:hypothetical protein [Deinococcus arenicola]|uniref:Uncharacterized protein n=1 Tax=Deinococcus arenicola TaxID=2994950 RepID=A0ABU4DX34_9DEIO|nr:hypothetical protein [Deinococcus sp. ZS9-10]MDV6376234.1 hypothetical protein [Deinococcus sp. ZS9-10]